MKPSKGKPVTIVYPQNLGSLKLYYTAEQMQVAAGKDPAKAEEPKAQKGKTQLKPTTKGGLTLDIAAEPPFKKLMAFKDNDKRFAQTWAEERNDMNDSSPSGYDLSLATQLANNGFSDQEIANTLIYWRRIQDHNPEKLVKRRKLTESLLANCRTNQALGIEEPPTGGLPRPEDMVELTEESRQSAIEYIGRCLNLSIIDIVCEGVEDSEYVIVLKGNKEVRIGNAKCLLSKPTVQAKLFDTSKQILPKCTKEKWDNMCQQLARVATFFDTGLTEFEKHTEWIELYIDQYPMPKSMTDELRNKRGVEQQPFYQAGNLFISMDHFSTYLRINKSFRVPSEAVARTFRRMGFTKKTDSFTHVRPDSKTDLKRRRYWRGKWEAGKK